MNTIFGILSEQPYKRYISNATKLKLEDYLELTDQIKAKDVEVATFNQNLICYILPFHLWQMVNNKIWNILTV